MAKKSGRRYGKVNREENEQAKASNDPWLSRKTGGIIMIIASLALVGYMTYQLNKTESFGFWESLLWGIGFGVAIWGVFFLAYFFNKWMRRQ